MSAAAYCFFLGKIWINRIFDDASNAEILFIPSKKHNGLWPPIVWPRAGVSEQSPELLLAQAGLTEDAKQDRPWDVPGWIAAVTLPGLVGRLSWR